jgi:hypothetical protein
MNMDEPQQPDGKPKDLAWFVNSVIAVTPKISSARSAADPLVVKLFELNKNIIV